MGTSDCSVEKKQSGPIVKLTNESRMHYSREPAWHINPMLNKTTIKLVNMSVICCLQCFDAVGWVAGRASSL